MKSAALKAACLSVGLATAWSPLGGQEVLAGTQVNVHLNIGSSGLYADPTSFSHVLVGLLKNDDTSYEIHPLTGSVYSTSNFTQTASFNSAFDAADIAQFVAVGVTPNHHVMVSIGDINHFANEDDDPITWASVFGAVDENAVAAQLEGDADYSFITSLLSPPAEGVLQSVANPFPPPDYNISTLYNFSDAVASGDVSLSFSSLTVPLPNEIMMGGALFAMLGMSKLATRWLRFRDTLRLA